MGNFSLQSLLMLITITIFSSSESKTHYNDVQVLKQLKQSIDPNSITPGSCLSTWDFKFDPCDSIFSPKFMCGLRCDYFDQTTKTNRVTELNLDKFGYSGSLGSVSWNLPYLQVLEMSDNYFSGSVPESLSRLTRLTRLGLSRNSFTGWIPSSIGSLSNLEVLSLSYNGLQGQIPKSFKGLLNLKTLDLQQNNLSGEFPDLGWLPNLQYLDVSNNRISGYIPSNFPISLVIIAMRNNNLQGSVPQNIKFLKYLQVMDFSTNSLSGSIPLELFEHESLQQLTLSNNKFQYIQIPYNLGMQSELVALDLSNNDIYGFLPVFMSLMPRLSALSLENNRFTGLIPVQYALRTVLMPGNGMLSPFSRLLLGGNYLFGPLPGPFMKLRPGSAMVSVVDNCLLRCPAVFFFCQGREQKLFGVCKSFDPLIP